jgi:hypothetical protein
VENRRLPKRKGRRRKRKNENSDERKSSHRELSRKSLGASTAKKK